MRRIGLAVVLAVGCGLMPLDTEAQPVTKRIGYLAIVEIEEWDEAFLNGLQEHGFVPGRNIQIEYRFAGGNAERLGQLAAGLVDLKVDVIFVSGTQALDVAKLATKTIAIVFPVGSPVESGDIANLARPDGNLTGLTTLNVVVVAKRLELLKEAVPRLSQVAVLWNPRNSASALTNQGTQEAARRLGIRLQSLEVRNSGDLDTAFQAIVKEHPGALVATPDNFLFSQRVASSTLPQKIGCPEFSARRSGCRSAA